MTQLKARIPIEDQRRLDDILGTDAKFDKELSKILNGVAEDLMYSKNDPKGIGPKIRDIGYNVTLADMQRKNLIEVEVKATENRLHAEVELKKTPRPYLKRFDPIQTGTGVSYMIDRRQGRRMNLRAFGPNIRLLGRGVWNREAGPGPTGLVGRVPIWRKKGLSPWGFYVGNRLGKNLAVDAATHLKRRTSKRIAQLMRKRG